MKKHALASRSLSIGVGLLFTLTSSIALAKSHDYVFNEIKVEFRGETNQADLASHLAQGFGWVHRREGGAWIFRIKDPSALGSTMDAWKRRSSVREVEAIIPHLPQELIKTSGLSKLEQVIDEYKTAYWAYHPFRDEEEDLIEEGEEGMEEVPGLDFLETYLEHKRLRAYPNQEIDFSGYIEVAQRRLQQPQPNGNERPRGLPGMRFPGEAPAPRAQEDFSGNWEFMGPRDLRAPYRIYFGLSPVNGRINALAVHPTQPNTFYAGGAQGGVWRTTDAGVNWEVLTDNWPLLGVSSVEIHPTNPNIILAGTGDYFGYDVAGIGVMRTTDGGTTWTRTGVNMGNAAISRIKFDPTNPNIVVAVGGRTGGNGLWRSNDAGQTWTLLDSSIAYSDLSVGVAPSGQPNTMWAVAGGSSFAVRRSDDRGATWTNVTPPSTLLTGSQNPLAVAASTITPGTVYVLSTTQRRILKSTDFGATWADTTNNFPTGGTNNYNWSQGWYDYHITASSTTPTGGSPQDVLWVGLIDINVSVNGGTTWRNAGGTNYASGYSNSAIVHVDHHGFAIDPQNPDRFLAGSDGGVFLGTYAPSTDALTWSRLNKNLGVTQFYTLAVHPTNPDYVKGGTQDNSTPHSFGNLALWQNPGAGDGAGCAINPFNVNFQYNSSQYHGLSKTTNAYGGQSGFKPSFGSDSVPFIGKLWLDPNNGRYVYVNTNYLWRYDEDTDTWTARVGAQALSTNSRVNWVEVAPGDSNLIYTGSGDGQLWMSRNFGSTWTRIDRQGLSGGLPNRAITSISANPLNKNEILIGLGGSGGNLYRCSDTTATSPTFTNVSGSGSTGLPSVIVNTVVRDPWRPATTWYAGNDVGVFVTENAGSTWTDITQARGLPNVQVNQLIANQTTGYLTAATFGRGIWRMKLVPVNLQSVSAEPIISGDGGTATVVLQRAAPAGGVTVALTSANPARLGVPASVFVAEGATSATFPVTTTEGTSNTSVDITASLSGNSVVGTVNVLGMQLLQTTRGGARNSINETGSFANIDNEDTSVWSWSMQDPRTGFTEAVMLARAPSGSTSTSRLVLRAKSSVANTTFRVLFYNSNTRTFTQVGSGVIGTSYSTNVLTLPSVTPYLAPGQEFRYSVIFDKSASSSTLRVDVDRLVVRTR
ncbi:MAG: hypothetical protein LCH41_00785 [Armatimonadetes bacterium]|nr:hypothetical protein [Armatimonadota bacterium]